MRLTFIVTARIVCRAGFMKWHGVLCMSSMCPQQQTCTEANPLLQVCCCGLGGQDISIDCCSSGGQMRAVSRCQRTWVAEHRLVFFFSFHTLGTTVVITVSFTGAFLWELFLKLLNDLPSFLQIYSSSIRSLVVADQSDSCPFGRRSDSISKYCRLSAAPPPPRCVSKSLRPHVGLS